MEPKLFFSFCFILNVFINFMALEDYFISLIFYLHFDFLCQRSMMSQINVGIILCLLSTILPNMRPKNPSRSSKYNVGSGMKGNQCLSSFNIYCSMNIFSNYLIINLFVQKMKKTFPNFLHIVYIIRFVLDCDYASIMNLPS